ncbi:hypothetical protein Vretimale_15204 [Volvox reticuliferus]|uniref:Uncharacterized protein n=1 Tax=Volvox reticuliferus TaxID=1737510 RepID=A0A8J4FKB2_9CHLO|nr:hypothetical protein Vretifemale_5399 [Volvox reticuliferus]GIM11742.1 hypothetical protein Vretimale_15204 [Volvox reticuliferus]
MESQHQPAAQPSVQSTMQGLVYGAAFVNHCMHPQLQQLADVQWKIELSAKLAAILEKLRERFSKSQNVCLCQTWVGADCLEAAPPNSLEVTLWADPRLAIVLDPLFEDLRAKSCQGPVFFRNSMPGKVWRSGAVQIVQNLRILPPSLHPRSQLSEAALERLAEALYIPIYDLSRPARGQVCVLEVLLSTRATEAMLVADVISFIGNLLTALHLSLANPVQQPVRRSVLSGRRPRAPDSDGEASGGEGASPSGRTSDPQQQQQPVACGPQSRQAQEAEPCPRDARQQCPGKEGGGGGATTRPALSVEAATGVGSCRNSASDVCRGGASSSTCGSRSGEVHANETAAVAATGSAAGAAMAGTAAADAGHVGPRCVRGGPEAAPSCSEQPTLPASPSHERLLRAGAAAHVAASSVLPGGGTGAQGLGCNGVSAYPVSDTGQVPRKLRRVLDGPMQRTKSVVSVTALSQGAEESDDEADGDKKGQGQAPSKGTGALARCLQEAPAKQ